MKRILLAVMMIFLVQSAAYAVEGKGRVGKFINKKGKLLENIETKRGLLKDFERCVKSANSPEDLKSCREKNKKKKEAMRAERKDMKEKMKKERKESKEERKEKRKEKREKREKDRD